MDVRVLSFGETGFSRYINNLLKHLVELDRENTYTLYLNRSQRIEAIEGNNNFLVRVINGPFLIYKSLLLPFYLWRDKIEIFHSMTHDLPPFVFCKKIITFYDLNVEFLRRLYIPKLRLLSYFRISRLSARFADKIIAISTNTKTDLVKLYKVPAEKIQVILLAAEETFRPENKESARGKIKKNFGIQPPFILYVGQIRVQKNVPRLLDAFKKIKEKGFPHRLVLVGSHNTGSEFYDLASEIEKRGLKDEVIHISNCNRTEDLASFYNAADLFTYLSLYEGFGLPVLEAMACGTAVVASRVASIPEVAGGAGILINPYNVDEIAQTLYRVLKDNDLRNELIDKGLKRVTKFSWLRTAQETLSLYKKC